MAKWEHGGIHYYVCPIAYQCLVSNWASDTHVLENIRTYIYYVTLA